MCIVSTCTSLARYTLESVKLAVTCTVSCYTGGGINHESCTLQGDSPDSGCIQPTVVG